MCLSFTPLYIRTGKRVKRRNAKTFTLVAVSSSYSRIYNKLLSTQALLSVLLLRSAMGGSNRDIMGQKKSIEECMHGGKMAAN